MNPVNSITNNGATLVVDNGPSINLKSSNGAKLEVVSNVLNAADAGSEAPRGVPETVQAPGPNSTNWSISYDSASNTMTLVGIDSVDLGLKTAKDFDMNTVHFIKQSGSDMVVTPV